MQQQLTLQIFHRKHWHDVGTLSFDDSDSKSEKTFEYTNEYALAHMDENAKTAIGCFYPVELMRFYRSTTWFGFIDDLLPAGANRRWWLNHLNLNSLPSYQQNVALLQHAIIAPVGNIRIKECVQDVHELVKEVKFSQQDVTSRNTDFLEYAQVMGAASGGATGAGGEAPKLLLCQNKNDEVWIDTLQESKVESCTHYLVKFPRGNRTQIDKDILRAEYHYYQELHDLGVDTIPIEQMKLLEDNEIPSLWLPRFDVIQTNGERDWLGMESIYSLLNRPAGSYLRHQEVFQILVSVTNVTSKEELEQLTVEYLKRDLLNIAFGNSDNHGRNMAVLKSDTTIQLAPVYDFAPMKMDPEGVTRSTTWGQPFEIGGEYQWKNIINTMGTGGELKVDLEKVFSSLCFFAEKLIGLKQRLHDRGVPESILNAPNIGFDYLDEKLARWGLIDG